MSSLAAAAEARNQARETVEQARESNLVVMGYRKSATPRRLKVDYALEIANRVESSVMLIPYYEEER